MKSNLKKKKRIFVSGIKVRSLVVPINVLQLVDLLCFIHRTSGSHSNLSQ
jgi:hypothetical protein